jgi:hypothetical protein
MSTRPSNRPLLARLLTVAAVAALSMPEASAQSISFSSDFESLTLDDPYALSADGWLVFGNVFNGVTGARLYGYGPFPAPNSTAPPPPNPAFCGVTTGEGGPDQGAQGLVVFSDYNNADHANGHQIESNVYRESPPITAANVGDYVFQFDAKKGDLVAPSTAIAFIKTINPADGKLTNFITLDTSDLPVTWGTYTLTITLRPTPPVRFR